MADYEQFTARVLDLDRRMATCVCQAYDDCVCSESAFKVRAAGAAAVGGSQTSYRMNDCLGEQGT